MDNHTVTLQTFYPQLTAYEASSSNRDIKDNIFDCEFDDFGAGGQAQQRSGDAFLVVCNLIDPSQGRWCANRYDPLFD